jgi:hypothetical protein
MSLDCLDNSLEIQATSHAGIEHKHDRERQRSQSYTLGYLLILSQCVVRAAGDAGTAHDATSGQNASVTQLQPATSS